MPTKIVCYLGLICLLLCSGCGLKEGVVTKDSKSFLWFTGNTQNAIVYIDDLAPVDLSGQAVVSSDAGADNKGEVHYRISPGKHTVVVKKSGVEVVHRTVLLGDDITKEIRIP